MNNPNEVIDLRLQRRACMLLAEACRVLAQKMAANQNDLVLLMGACELIQINDYITDQASIPECKIHSDAIETANKTFPSLHPAKLQAVQV